MNFFLIHKVAKDLKVFHYFISNTSLLDLSLWSIRSLPAEKTVEK